MHDCALTRAKMAVSQNRARILRCETGPPLRQHCRVPSIGSVDSLQNLARRAHDPPDDFRMPSVPCCFRRRPNPPQHLAEMDQHWTVNPAEVQFADMATSECGYGDQRE